MQIFTTLDNPALIALLQDGAVGVIPTDTVYGVVCRAANEQTVAKLYALKEREHKPGTVVAASIEQLADLGIKARYLKAVAQFWPGAVSVIIPVPNELYYLTQDLPDLATRVPNYSELTALLQQTGPLLTSSANLPGEAPANTLSEAQAYFGNRVDFYVDGGNLAGREPSTLIRVLDDAIEVLRQGAVQIDENGRMQP